MYLENPFGSSTPDGRTRAGVPGKETRDLRVVLLRQTDRPGLPALGLLPKHRVESCSKCLDLS